MMRPLTRVREMELRSQRWAIYMLPGSCRGMTAVMPVGWLTVAFVIRSPGLGRTAVPQRLRFALLASPTKSRSCTVSTATNLSHCTPHVCTTNCIQKGYSAGRKFEVIAF
uniref:Uncharacterized protein n=1 Tax=Sinocyclocheilus anshuiensis TaxID=1608454 RepID=A0A671SAG8_9TELE